MTLRQAASLWRTGRPIGLWSLSCEDSYDGAPAALACQAALRARPRDIILLHDTRPLVLEVLQTLIPNLRRRAIKSVPLNTKLAR
jgi:hypothetical protein